MRCEFPCTGVMGTSWSPGSPVNSEASCLAAARHLSPEGLLLHGHSPTFAAHYAGVLDHLQPNYCRPFADNCKVYSDAVDAFTIELVYGGKIAELPRQAKMALLSFDSGCCWRCTNRLIPSLAKIIAPAICHDLDSFGADTWDHL